MSNGRQSRSPLLQGFLLILLGVAFLVYRFEPGLRIGHLLATYWPLLIILWGVSRLIEHLRPQQPGAGRPAFLSGGEAALLVAVIVVLSLMAVAQIVHERFPGVAFDFGLSLPFTQTQNVTPEIIPAGSHVAIETDRGTITVHAGGGSELVVTANKSANGSNETAAQDRMQKANVVIEQTADGYVVRPTQQDVIDGDRVTVNFDVEVPKDVLLTARTDKGDVHISGVGGAVTVATQNGDLEIRDAGGDVSATMQKGDAHIIGVTGDVNVTGKGNEIEISNVTGDATISGNFYGPIRADNIGKTLQCSAQESEVTLEHLTGRMVLDSGRIEVSGTTGAVNVSTKHKDISMENVAGRLDVADSHGDIEVRYSKPPREEVNIINETGEVDIVLPSNSSFEIVATSKSGEAQSDFTSSSLTTTSNGEVGSLSGKIGNGGPKISIATTYGTIRLRKAS